VKGDVLLMMFETPLLPLPKMLGFVIFHKQTHVLFMFSPLLQSSQQQVDIVLSKNGVRTMVDVVIIHPTQENLVLKVAIFKGVVTIVTQVNDGLYCN
jgi:hypothetical protein